MTAFSLNLQDYRLGKMTGLISTVTPGHPTVVASVPTVNTQSSIFT